MIEIGLSHTFFTEHNTNLGIKKSKMKTDK